MTQSFINPLSKFTTDTLGTLPYSRLYFFENESSTPKEVFKNQAKSVSWGTYATSDSAGNFAPIWYDGIVRAELRNAAGVVQTGWPIDHIGSDVSFDTDVTVNGDLTADNLISLGGVEADTASGFITTDYTLNARNPIWSFGNANTYGISYFAGATSIGNDDVIGIHFGTATEIGSEFLFDQNGNFTASGDVTVGDDLVVTDDASVGGDLSVTGSISVTNDITIGDDLVVTGSIDASSVETTGTMQTGTGVIFPNVNSVSATVLDYYEESTFTPVLIGTSTAGTGTYTLQVGKQTRIGNIVFVSVELAWTAHTGTGNMRITGLTYAGSSDIRQALMMNYSKIDIGGNIYQGGGQVSFTNQINLVRSLNGGGGVLTSIPIDTAGSVQISGFYFV